MVLERRHPDGILPAHDEMRDAPFDGFDRIGQRPVHEIANVVQDRLRKRLRPVDVFVDSAVTRHA